MLSDISTQTVYDQAMFTATQGNINNTSNMLNTTTSKDKEAVLETAQDFEAVFITEMISHMTETIDVDPVFGGGHGEKMFKSMLNREYGRLIAENGGIGLANNVTEQMLKIQEMQNSGRI